MRNFSKIFTLATFFVAGVFATTVVAEEKKKAAKQYDYQMMTTKSIAEQRTSLLASVVNLSEDQKAKVLEVELKLAEQQIALKDKFKGTTDREAIKKAHADVLNAREEAIKSILTEEQYEKLKSTELKASNAVGSNN